MLAGMGSGHGAPLSLSGAFWSKVQRTFDPDEKRHARYGERLAAYHKLIVRPD